jgi:hypothetical protein
MANSFRLFRLFRLKCGARHSWAGFAWELTFDRSSAACSAATCGMQIRASGTVATVGLWGSDHTIRHGPGTYGSPTLNDPLSMVSVAPVPLNPVRRRPLVRIGQRFEVASGCCGHSVTQQSSSNSRKTIGDQLNLRPSKWLRTSLARWAVRQLIFGAAG